MSHAAVDCENQEQTQQHHEEQLEQGLKLFKLQKQRLEECGVEDSKKRAESIRILEDVAADPKLSSANKVVFAETLREVNLTGHSYIP